MGFFSDDARLNK